MMEDQVLPQETAVNTNEETSSGSAPDVQDNQPVQPASDDGEQKATVDRAEYENLQKALQQEREAKRKLKEFYEASSAPTYTPPQTPAGDEQGYVDPDQFAAQIEQRALRKFEFIQQDKEEWNQALGNHSELKENSALADAVRSYRNQKLVEGEYLTYDQAAEQVLKPFRKATTAAKDEGRREAQVSETIQRRAVVEAPGQNVAPATTRIDELRRIMKNGSAKEAEAARVEYLSLMYPRN